MDIYKKGQAKNYRVIFAGILRVVSVYAAYKWFAWTMDDILFGQPYLRLDWIGAGILLILGGCFLIWKRYIRWQMPVVYIATVALLGWALPERVAYLQDGALRTSYAWFMGDPLFHVFSGGLILGAFFMATDYVTSPLTGKGKIIFGFGLGIITMGIRLYGNLPEGVSFSILFMNVLVPLIDRYTLPKSFGGLKKKNA